MKNDEATGAQCARSNWDSAHRTKTMSWLLRLRSSEKYRWGVLDSIPNKVKEDLWLVVCVREREWVSVWEREGKRRNGATQNYPFNHINTDISTAELNANVCFKEVIFSLIYEKWFAATPYLIYLPSLSKILLISLFILKYIITMTV